MKQMEVQIMGHGYVLGVPEGGEARLQAAVRKVDTAMCRIRDAGRLKARDRIAVLAALNLAFDLAAREGSASAMTAAAAATTTQGLSLAATAPDARLGALLQRLDAALVEDGESVPDPS